MKYHMPLKRHQAIVSFSKDHHFGLLLVWKIRHGLNSAVDPRRISNYVIYFFKEDLAKHFREEEQFLFSKLADNDVLRKQAEAEHLVIYDLIAAIEENKYDAILLKQLADKLEKHIRFEERQLFIHLQNTISSAELESLENRFSNNSKAIEEKWEDVFWEVKK